MLESIVTYSGVSRRPWMVFVWGFIISSVAILVSTQLWFHVSVSGISVNLTGIFSVLFTIIPSIFFVTMLIRKEEDAEEKDIKRHYHETQFWERHVRDFMIFLFFFAGVTLAFAFWYLILPGVWGGVFGTEIAAKDAFVVQVSKINQMRGMTGAATGLSPYFSPILTNNLNVMMFSFIFSFIFGAGAVFIIVWNASILGVAIAKDARHIFDIPTLSSLYVMHGVPEIAAYVSAALAGGLISAAIIRRHGSDILGRVVIDATFILMFSVFSVVCGALIEASTGAIFWGATILWWGGFVYLLLRFFLKW